MNLRHFLTAGTLLLSLLNPLSCISSIKKYPYAEKALQNPYSLEKRFQDPHFGIVIVDMQQEFLKKINKIELRDEITNQMEILNIATKYDLPVLVFEYQGYSTTISQIKQKINQVPRHIYYIKQWDSGFSLANYYKSYFETPWEWFINKDVDTLYFMGVNSEFCVKGSAIDAFWNFNFNVATSIDVIASNSCVDNCKSVYNAFNFFAKEGYLGLNHKEFIDYVEQTN